ncbi:MAG: hypothetical protein ACYSUL_00460 [Planctomycetota bacterium]|jgi:hypothetical protein
MMLNALPQMQAPPNMLRDIKLRLEEKTILEEPAPLIPQKKTDGAASLFYRRLLKVAAMIALLAVLTGVIYTLVAPSDTTQKTFVDRPWQQPVQIAQDSPEEITESAIVEEIPVKETFDGKIILTTENLLALDAFMNRTIIEMGLVTNTQLDSEKNRSVFDINCGQDELEKLMVQLGTVWKKCDTKTLQLYTQQFPDQITVQNVNPQQIIQLANLNSVDEQIKVSQEFRTLNDIKASLPGQKIFASLEIQEQFSFNIPKPVLTSAQPQPADQPAVQKEPRNVYLTIVIQDSK